MHLIYAILAIGEIFYPEGKSMSEKIAIEDIGTTGRELVNRVKISGGLSPVYLTEKGEAAYIVMPAGEYEKMKRQIQILSVIVEGEESDCRR